MRSTKIALFIFLSSISRAASADPSIAALVPVSGPFARIGELVSSGVTSGIDPKVTLIVDDEGCSAAKSVSSFRSLSARGQRLFLGPCCGASQIAVAPLLKSSNSLALLISSAPRDVFGLSGGRMFSVQFSIEDEASFLAQQIWQQQLKRVVILFAEGDFPRVHERVFREQFNGEVLETLTYPLGDVTALRALIFRARKLYPDALFVPDVSPFLLGLMREIHVSGQKALPVFSIYAVQSPDVLSANDRNLRGLSYSYPQIEGNALTHFPRLGAQMLSRVALTCGNDTKCAANSLRTNYEFDSNGVLRSPLTLRTFDPARFD